MSDAVFFLSNLWGAPYQRKDREYRVDQDIRQVWFAGVHSDVGGSYSEKESGLSKITLEWMLAEAVAAKLLVDPQDASIVLGRAPWIGLCTSRRRCTNSQLSSRRVVAARISAAPLL